MSEVLQGQALVGELHSEHLRAQRYMQTVAEAVEPIYEAWADCHSWDEITVPEGTIVPSPWRALGTIGNFEADHYKSAKVDIRKRGKYADACAELGIERRQFPVLLSDGLYQALEIASEADLFCEPDQIGFRPDQVHRTQLSLFTRERLIRTKGRTPGLLGEVILTHIGEGELEGYQALHTARLRCAKFIAIHFNPTLRSIASNHHSDTEALSRALVDEDRGEFRRTHYDPLTHAVIEGMMTIGQSVNYLAQPGIDGQVSLCADLESILKNKLPAVLSKIMRNGHLGPNQMAGLSVNDITIRTEKGIQVNPVILDIFRQKKAKEAAKTAHLEGSELEFMQLPAARAVNRLEGCPAIQLVRLQSRMLLDALVAA